MTDINHYVKKKSMPILRLQNKKVQTFFLCIYKIHEGFGSNPCFLRPFQYISSASTSKVNKISN